MAEERAPYPDATNTITPTPASVLTSAGATAPEGDVDDARGSDRWLDGSGGRGQNATQLGGGGGGDKLYHGGGSDQTEGSGANGMVVITYKRGDGCWATNLDWQKYC